MKGVGRAVRRLRVGEWIAAVSALFLLGSTFLDWFGAEPRLEEPLQLITLFNTGGNAWQALNVVPWLLLLVVLAAFVATALTLGGSSWRPVVPLDAVVAVLGGVATVLVLSQIVFPPDFGASGRIPIETNIELGAWLALAAAAGIAYGGYRAMGEEGSSFAVIADGLSRDTRRKQGKDAGKPPRRAR